MTLSSSAIIHDPIGRYPQATVACFDPTCGNLPRRQLDEARTMVYLERLASAGAMATLIASSTGRGHLRTIDELTAWFDCAARADTGEMLRLALLRPEDGLDANKRLLDRLAAMHYPVVFFRPGTDLDPSALDEEVSASLAPLVSAAAERDLAIGLYSISDVSGLPLTPEAVARLVVSSGGGHIVAVKVTEKDYERSTARFLVHPDLKRLKIVQGWDPHLGRALRDGPRHDSDGRQRVGITSGLMALAVYQYRYLLQAASEEDWDEVAQAHQACTLLFQAMQDDPHRFADLQRAKYIMGLGQPLTGTVTSAQVKRIFKALESLPRPQDRRRVARSLDLMGDGPYHRYLRRLYELKPNP
ncbi:beta/alpha barrel domain-containing protein [Methylohalobius crimeensis]|uniref:hypothetical protein n=1 Tax=Methylohalobius crimeensis TaxID=244365 RepID=UPI0003B47625|nr:hypothetical protein [Methylohalobius crimeensis]